MYKRTARAAQAAGSRVRVHADLRKVAQVHFFHRIVALGQAVEHVLVVGGIVLYEDVLYERTRAGYLKLKSTGIRPANVFDDGQCTRQDIDLYGDITVERYSTHFGCNRHSCRLQWRIRAKGCRGGRRIRGRIRIGIGAGRIDNRQSAQCGFQRCPVRQGKAKLHIGLQPHGNRLVQVGHTGGGYSLTLENGVFAACENGYDGDHLIDGRGRLHRTVERVVLLIVVHAQREAERCGANHRAGLGRAVAALPHIRVQVVGEGVVGIIQRVYIRRGKHGPSGIIPGKRHRRPGQNVLRQRVYKHFGRNVHIGQREILPNGGQLLPCAAVVYGRTGRIVCVSIIAAKVISLGPDVEGLNKRCVGGIGGIVRCDGLQFHRGELDIGIGNTVYLLSSSRGPCGQRIHQFKPGIQIVAYNGVGHGQAGLIANLIEEGCQAGRGAHAQIAAGIRNRSHKRRDLTFLRGSEVCKHADGIDLRSVGIAKIVCGVDRGIGLSRIVA